jgi:hypothetical protein
MRGLSTVLLLLAATALAQSALAEETDYSGRWLFSGLVTGGRAALSFAQVCDLSQTGTQVAGSCRGPNGGCSAVGVVNGGQIDLTCRVTVPNNPSINGVITFHGNLSPDGVLRGSCSHSRAPGIPGQAAMMRI